jgi:hypothetical protein
MDMTMRETHRKQTRYQLKHLLPIQTILIDMANEIKVYTNQGTQLSDQHDTHKNTECNGSVARPEIVTPGQRFKYKHKNTNRDD